MFGMTVKDLLSGKEPGGKSVSSKKPSIKEFSAIYTEGLPKRERGVCVEALIAILLKGQPEDKKTVQTLKKIYELRVTYD
jgi:hypothetical protein